MDEPSLTKTMAAIQRCQNKLIECFGELKLDFSYMKRGMQKIREKAQAANEHIDSLEDTVGPMDTVVQVAKKAISEHTLKMAYTEDCMRQKNSRLVWFPEGAEGSHLRSSWKVGLWSPGTLY